MPGIVVYECLARPLYAAIGIVHGGHSHLNQDRKEFPAKNRVDWERSFEPFVDDGIIALDACTAYTEFCNCVVLEG